VWCIAAPVPMKAALGTAQAGWGRNLREVSPVAAEPLAVTTYAMGWGSRGASLVATPGNDEGPGTADGGPGPSASRISP